MMARTFEPPRTQRDACGVAGVPSGRVGARILLRGDGFGRVASMVHVGIGGAACHVRLVNQTSIECVLDPREATAGVWPVALAVEGLGFARHTPPWTVNYTVALVIDSVAPLNGSLVGGTEITISGSGFARLGPLNLVDVGGVPCVPKTLRNLACRASAYDSGEPCAATTAHDYPMVASVREEDYASRTAANVRYFAEWFDFSNPQRIVCVMDDIGSARRDGARGIVNVTLPGATACRRHGRDVLEQQHPTWLTRDIDMATQTRSASRCSHTACGTSLPGAPGMGGGCCSDEAT